MRIAQNTCIMAMFSLFMLFSSSPLSAAEEPQKDSQPTTSGVNAPRKLVVQDGVFGAPASVEENPSTEPAKPAQTEESTPAQQDDSKSSKTEPPKAQKERTPRTPKPVATGNGAQNSQQYFIPNRYIPVFQAWIDEPFIFYRVVPSPNGPVPLPSIGYNRRLVQVFYDRVTNAYGYFDQFGNPVPYKSQRYRWGYNPF